MRLFACAVIGCVFSGLCPGDWRPVEGKIMTRWAAELSPDNALPEYPRPLMVRPDWLNLNGLWEYAILPRTAECPDVYEGRILVPYPVESALSGVGRRVGADKRLWYRRTFERPAAWRNRRLLLHFGAADWQTDVWVNGMHMGRHQGGYDPFSLDITRALRGSGSQELVVSVWDPTDAGYQPRGKQVRDPKGIWYTSVTGIWQTVWLEPVPETSMAGLKITPDLDRGRVVIEAAARGEAENLSVTAVVTGGGFSAKAAASNKTVTVDIADPRLWSPDDPFLYDLVVRLTRGAEVVDEVRSYFGMRKIEMKKDAGGINRLFLNHQPLFQYGLLDQGWWPDGLYTAPTDAALRYDVEMTKKLGFNMLRKHVKVEPQRFYFWCDRIGVLVWQDMPNGDGHIGHDMPDLNRSPHSAQQYEYEYRRLIESFGNHPSIVTWVPFNEGWGQFDTRRITEWTKELDPTRLVINASGWTDRKVGDIHDVHQYPGPAKPALEEDRAVVLGEFGGLGLPVSGHTWQDEDMWGYRSYTTAEALTEAYAELIRKLNYLVGEGLAAAVYTQTTDVEVEVNGLMTYDRAVIKMAPDVIAPLNRSLYKSPPVVRTVLPNAGAGSCSWDYTFEKPSPGWVLPDFDASDWKAGPGGFGTEGTRGARIGTIWNTPEIWLRREFELTRADLETLFLSIHHDDEATVYLNGAEAARLSGWTNEYTLSDVSTAGKNALRTGKNVMAVFCGNQRGGQFIDVGLLEAAGGQDKDFYVNPVIDHLADPSVLFHEGMYYLYPTGGVAGGYRVYTSRDLVHWEPGPAVYRREGARVMAPDVWKDPDSGRFYLYWTVNEEVGAAVADSPLGPFEDVRSFVSRAIDGHLFRDEDGRLYLYYVKFPGFKITVQPMKSPTEPQGRPVVILQPESDWEMRQDKVTEGPWMLKQNQQYYLLYSGTHTKSPDYAIGYAVADSPMGPFRRAVNNPIVRREGHVFGPGHGSVIKDGRGQMWLVYHQKRTDQLDFDRFVCIDPIGFDEQGLLVGKASRGVPRPAPITTESGGPFPEAR